MSNPETAKINQETVQILNTILTKMDSIQRGGESGIVPAKAVVDNKAPAPVATISDLIIFLFFPVFFFISFLLSHQNTIKVLLD